MIWDNSIITLQIEDIHNNDMSYDQGKKHE